MIPIYPYSSEFTKKFKKEKVRLEMILGDGVRIEHFGSTAIPGVLGKGVVDIIIGFDSWVDVQKAIPLLQINGYILSYDNQRKDRIFLSTAGKKESSFLDIHLHLTNKNSSVFKDALLFRDYLKKNRELKKQYNQLKEQIVKIVKNDRKLYTKLKSNFIKKILN
ncbi:GrpB family protein [Candidatus Daviesbacteria bacterium]|nr:GrpB family protein [Candidatus Daviesbacteria bacterium]